MITIVDAIVALHPNDSFVLRGDDYTKIEWNSTPKNPATLEQVNAKLAELQADYDSKQYQRDRESAFPSWQEQLDMQYWDKVNGTNKWQEALAKVKAKYPKPE